VHAPVSKLVWCATAAGSLLCRAYKAQFRAALTPRGLARGELWRLLTTNLVCSTPGEAVCGKGSHSSTSQLNWSRVCHKKTPYTP
jgi:hypothetical protein